MTRIVDPAPTTAAIIRQCTMAAVIGLVPAFAWLGLLVLLDRGHACTLRGVGCPAIDPLEAAFGLLGFAALAGALMVLAKVVRAWQVALAGPVVSGIFTFAAWGLPISLDGRAAAPTPWWAFAVVVVLSYGLAALICLPGAPRVWSRGAILLVAAGFVVGVARHPPTYLWTLLIKPIWTVVTAFWHGIGNALSA